MTEKIYTIKLVRSKDGERDTLETKCEGFSPMEVLGILDYLHNSRLIDLVKGYESPGGQNK